MQKHRLMTPGPSLVPEETLLELARPMVHHRTPEFKATLQRVLADLRYVFQTNGDVLVMTASGTGAMEAALVNSLAPGETALVLAAGRFGERWAEIAEAFGIRAVLRTVPPGESVSPDQLQTALAENPDVAMVCATLCETSTGARHDLAAMGSIVAKTAALFAVDAVSGAGAMECRTDEWKIDILVTGSQKALMIPPGLAFLSVSRKAWERIERVRPQAYYFDLQRMRREIQIPDTPFTSAHTLIQALAVSLQRIRAEGIDAVWARHRRTAAACRAGVRALGLELFARDPADAVTAVAVPAALNVNQLLARLVERFGIRLAGGQDELKGKLFRIAHMGYIDELDIVATIAALEVVLAEIGWTVSPGAAVAAAQRSAFAIGGVDDSV